MSILKDCPRVLFQKLLFTILIGFGCLLVGAAYYLFSHDRIFLALSALVTVFSLFRGWNLFVAIKKKSYETVEGTCVAVAQKAFRKHYSVKIMDESGIESTLHLGKQAKIKIGTKYRFYYDGKNNSLSLGSEYFDTALSSNHFIGFEELGEYK